MKQPGLRWTLLILLGTVPAGCGRESTTGEPARATAAADHEPTNAPVAAAAPRDARTKWIGDVPYDVFYDRPLETYQQAGGANSEAPAIAETPVVTTPATASTTTTPAPETAASLPTEPAKPGDAGLAVIDWTDVAPISVLDAESKEIRARLAANLQTVATYNANMDAIETDGSVLALIAAVIERHSESLNWQDRAPLVRQLAYDIYLNASAKGRGPFEKTKEPFEKIVAIWDGGPPPEMEAAPQAPLGEVGDRAQVMLRFESGFNWLRADINTEQRLREDHDRVVRETTVLAVLGTVLSDSTFDGADQESYRSMLQDFIEGQVQMKTAAADNDFAAFEQGRSRVEKSCAACHLEYRNSSSE